MKPLRNVIGQIYEGCSQWILPLDAETQCECQRCIIPLGRAIVLWNK